MTVNETQRTLARSLSSIYPDREARWIARVVMLWATGWSDVDLLLNADKPLGDYRADLVGRATARLLAHEPVQYVTGEAPFYGMTLHVDRSTLIPRPETAELVDMIVADAANRPDLRVLDIGTGSGCIAIALARNLRFPVVEAIDISPEALSVAKGNASMLKAGVKFRLDDILAYSPSAEVTARRPEGYPPSEVYDIVVSNPPYIAEAERAGMDANVLDYEPAGALFVPDSDPLRFYRAISSYAAVALGGGGRLYFEINPLYADATAALVADTGFTDVRLWRDSQGANRFISATHA